MATTAPVLHEDAPLRAEPFSTPPATEPIDVVLLGLGQIGSAVVRAAGSDSGAAAGRIRIRTAFVRDGSKPRAVTLPRGAAISHDARNLFTPRPGVVVEALGGVEPAFALVSRALALGIPVVTANKSLLAARGPELAAIASRGGAALLYEASVLAGVPFLGALASRPSAAAVTRIDGIVNGTSNFVLSSVAATGCDAPAALVEAQRRGFAEPDPRHDVEGVDAAEKLTILIRHFGWGAVRTADIERTGIAAIEGRDLADARAFGGTIKPVVVAERRAGAIHAFAGPAFLRASHKLASFDGAENAVRLRNGYGELLFAGPGAGPEATAATLVDDVIEAGGRRPGRAAEPAGAPHVDAPDTGWFLRLSAAGALPPAEEIADFLASHQIYLRSTSDRAVRDGGERVCFLTHPSSRERLESALSRLGAGAGCRSLSLRVVED